MSTLTLELDNALVRSLEESARREHKSLAAWARERLQMAAMETEAECNGYPAGWLKLFGSVEDETFRTPDRSAVNSVDPQGAS